MVVAPLSFHAQNINFIIDQHGAANGQATTESCAHLFYCIIHGAKKSISNLVVIVCVRATCDTIIAHFYLNCPEQQYEVRQRNSYM